MKLGYETKHLRMQGLCSAKDLLLFKPFERHASPRVAKNNSLSGDNIIPFSKNSNVLRTVINRK